MRRIVGYLGLGVVAFVAGVAVTVGTDPVDWNEQQWVDAAEWVGGLGTALALLLGLGILARDHADAERGRVDLVGAWAEPSWDIRGATEPRVEQVKIKVCVRNASELPVEVAQLGYSVYTTWVVPEGEGIWNVVPGTVPVRCFPEDFIVRPGHIYEVTTYEPNVAHTGHRMQCNFSPSQVSDAASTGS